MIHGGLDAATVNLPANPLARRTSFLVGRWVAQGWSAKLSPPSSTWRPRAPRGLCSPNASRSRAKVPSAWSSSSLPSTYYCTLVLSPCPFLCCCSLSFVYICPIACCYSRSLYCYYYRYHYHYHSCSGRYINSRLSTLRFAYPRPLLQSQQSCRCKSLSSERHTVHRDIATRKHTVIPYIHLYKYTLNHRPSISSAPTTEHLQL